MVQGGPGTQGYTASHALPHALPPMQSPAMHQGPAWMAASQGKSECRLQGQHGQQGQHQQPSADTHAWNSLRQDPDTCQPGAPSEWNCAFASPAAVHEAEGVPQSQAHADAAGKASLVGMPLRPVHEVHISAPPSRSQPDDSTYFPVAMPNPSGSLTSGGQRTPLSATPQPDPQCVPLPPMPRLPMSAAPSSPGWPSPGQPSGSPESDGKKVERPRDSPVSDSLAPRVGPRALSSVPWVAGNAPSAWSEALPCPAAATIGPGQPACGHRAAADGLSHGGHHVMGHMLSHLSIEAQERHSSCDSSVVTQLDSHSALQKQAGGAAGTGLARLTVDKRDSTVFVPLGPRPQAAPKPHWWVSGRRAACMLCVPGRAGPTCTTSFILLSA